MAPQNGEHRNPATEEALRRAIRDHGPISFAEFMEISLYGAGGFYEEPPVGQRGAFVTSPHVHPVFGELLGRGVEDVWRAAGSPAPFHLIELGAGDGTLATQLLGQLEGVPVEYAAVERSSGALKALASRGLRTAHGVETMGQGVDGCVIANELLDNLPFLRVRRTESGLREVCVGLRDDGRFVEVEVPCDESLLEEAPEVAVPEGSEIVFPLEALNMMYRTARLLASGGAIFIDYASSERGSVHGYRDHREVDDVLEAPGSADITAGVDLEALRDRAESLGLRAVRPLTQRAALFALGFDEWAAEARAIQAELLGEGAGREAVMAWSERNSAALLVDPAGLGALRWLVLLTPDVATPEWVERALVLDDAEQAVPQDVAEGDELLWEEEFGNRRC